MGREKAPFSSHMPPGNKANGSQEDQTWFHKGSLNVNLHSGQHHIRLLHRRFNVK